MCLRSIKEFAKPVKVMTGWKILRYKNGKYETPYLETRIKNNQKTLSAHGKKNIEYDQYSSTYLYHGGFIHCFRTRSSARYYKECRNERIIKVKCYGVKAFGTNGDLVCNKIEFLWDEKV